jgi:hypothetical protein
LEVAFSVGEKMKAKYVLAVLLTLSMLLYFLHGPLINVANADANALTWGTPMSISQHILVGGNAEIPKGAYAYVFNKQSTPNIQVMAADWEKLISGDLSDLRTQIETQVPGSQVVWLAVRWDNATKHTFTAYDSDGNPVTLYNYIVNGFFVEALVMNVNAGLTGLEIVAVIIAIAFLIAVIVLLANLTWIIWEVLSAAKQLGPAITIVVGLLLVMGLLFAVLLIFGVVFSYQGKNKSVSIGRTKASYFSFRCDG